MADDRMRSGSIILLVLVVIAAGAALAAFSMTGSKGIEERFEDAVGITGHHDTSELRSDTGGNGTEQRNPGESGGFTLEGSPVLYGVVLVILLAISFLTYSQFRN